VLPTFNAIIDSTDFTDKVVVRFAIKETLVDTLAKKITEMSGGKNSLEIVGERFDFR
jgi:hypothetical protein